MALRQQVLGIIQACEKVLDTIGKGKDAEKYTDNVIMQLANKMIEQAQAENKNDAVLGAVKLGDRMVSWTQLLTVMQVVYSSLPEDKAKI
jgi:hypothetical protein